VIVGPVRSWRHPPGLLGALVVLATAALLLACSILDPEDGPRDELQRAEEQWRKAGVTDYLYTVRRGCYCISEALGPAEVMVRNGAVEVRHPETGEPYDPDFAHLFPPVQGLFDLIRDAIERHADRLDVRYSAVLGYPEQIDIDYELQAADEELSVFATGFLPLR
jgi:hypothetical protein